MSSLDVHARCRPGPSPRPRRLARLLRRALAGTVAAGLLLIAACGEDDPNDPTVTTAVGTDGDDADNPGDNTPDDDGGLGTDDADGVGTDDDAGGGEIGDLPDEGGGTGTSVGNAEGRPDDIDDTGDTSEPTVDPGDSGGM